MCSPNMVIIVYNQLFKFINYLNVLLPFGEIQKYLHVIGFFFIFLIQRIFDPGYTQTSEAAFLNEHLMLLFFIFCLFFYSVL